MRFTIKKQLKKGIAVMAAAAMLFTGTGMTSYAKAVVVDQQVSEQGTKDAETEQTHSGTDAEQEDSGDGIALYNGDVAAYAANWADASNSYMQYYKVNGDYNQIDIQGYYNNAWLQTTFSNAGYTCVQENLDNAVIQATPSFNYGGRFVSVTYKVTAVNGAVTNGKLGIHADVQIGSNDYAAVTLVKENNKAVGFQMIDDNASYASYNACFRLYFAGSTLGGSEASTYWMGSYSSRYTNVYNQTGDTEVTGIDSGIALSWQNINLAKGESKEYKIMLGVGTEKDLQDAIGSGTDYNQECIKDLTPGNYEITITDESGKTYYFEGVTESGIPFKGTDSNGQPYDFTGKKLSIVKKNTDGTTSKPSQIEVAERPQAPAAVDMSGVTSSTDEKQVILKQASADQEYILVPEGTIVTEAMWENAQKAIGSSVTLTTDASNGQAIDITKKYVIYTRKYATSSAPKSDVTGPSEVIAFKIKDAEQSVIDVKTITTVSTTIYGKGDGKITGLSPEYEYSTDGGNTYTTCEGSELSGVSGTVKIRRKAKPNYAASEPIDVVIPEGKKIKLQVPGIKNCTITASPSEVAYNESATITIKPDSGYKLTEPLKAVIGGVERTFVKDSDGNYTCTISDIKGLDDLKVTGTTGVVEKSYEDVTPTTGSIKDITDSKDAAAETNAFASEIKNNSELEKLLDVTAQEKAQGVNIWLKVVDASASAPKADKKVIENAKNDFNVGMILDVSLFKKIGDQEAQKITNTNGMTKISVLVPEELRKSGRMYEIIRVHNGVPTVILPAYDAETYTLTFETDQFSTYAIVYKDNTQTKVEEAPLNPDTNKTQNAQVTDKSNAPETGDSFDPTMMFAIMGVALLAIIGIMNKKYKDDLREEKHQR